MMTRTEYQIGVMVFFTLLMTCLLSDNKRPIVAAVLCGLVDLITSLSSDNKGPPMTVLYGVVGRYGT
jgi:hypothetical protein